MLSTELVVGEEIVRQRLGPAASLISQSDFDWLVAEAARIEADLLALRQVEKDPLDFAAMTAPSA